MGQREGQPGVIPRACASIFEQVGSMQDQFDFLVTGSYIELHRDTLMDHSQGPRATRQVNKLNLRVDKSGNVLIQGLTKVHCESVDDLLAVVEAGTLARTVIATSMSWETGRSHI